MNNIAFWSALLGINTPIISNGGLCVCLSVFVCMSVPVCVFDCVCVYVSACVCVCLCLCVCQCLCLCVCQCPFQCLCVCVCVCVRASVCTRARPIHRPADYSLFENNQHLLKSCRLMQIFFISIFLFELCCDIRRGDSQSAFTPWVK